LPVYYPKRQIGSGDGGKLGVSNLLKQQKLFAQNRSLLAICKHSNAKTAKSSGTWSAAVLIIPTLHFITIPLDRCVSGMLLNLICACATNVRMSEEQKYTLLGEGSTR
jgi:hypothetical protein